jgi:hypothetical protein
MSLYKNSYDTPKYIFKNKHNFNIQVTYGIKCDGNICDLDNIYSMKNLIDEKFNFIIKKKNFYIFFFLHKFSN